MFWSLPWSFQHFSFVTRLFAIGTPHRIFGLSWLVCLSRLVFYHHSSSSFLSQNNWDCRILTTLHLDTLVVIQFLPQTFQKIRIFSDRPITKLCTTEFFGLNVINLSHVSNFGIGLLNNIPYLLAELKNMHVSLISRFMKLNSQDITNKSSSSQVLNLGYLGFGLVLSKWLSFPHPFRYMRTSWDHFK